MKTTLLSKSFLFFISLFFFSLNTIAQGTDDESEDDFVEINTQPQLRLGYYGHNNTYRQILLGFENQNCTDGIDPGYDAINTFDLPNDMYFVCNNTELFIQGVGEFNENNTYPIGVNSNAEGTIMIKLESTENFDANQTFYLYDADNNTYFDLKGGNYTTTVGSGTFNERFSLRFLNQALLGVDNPTLNNGIKVSYINSQNSVVVNNTLSDVIASDIVLFNINGQQVAKWNVASQNQTNIIVPVQGFSKGIYIANVQTTNGVITKKIVVR